MKRLLLEHPEELALRRRGKLPDLVQENRPAVGELELAEAARERAREGAAFVAEELALEERVGDRGAVDRDEGAAAAGRQLVDRAGEELLAGPALTLEQHGGVGRGHPLRLGLHRADRRRLPDDRRHRARPAVLEQERLALPRAPLDRARDEKAEKVRLDRLGDEVLGAALHRVHGGLDRAERGHHDHRKGGVEGSRRVEDGEPVRAGEAPVGQDEIDRLARLQELDRLGPGGDPPDVEIFGPKHLLEHRAQGVLVFDDEDPRHVLRVQTPTARRKSCATAFRLPATGYRLPARWLGLVARMRSAGQVSRLPVGRRL